MSVVPRISTPRKPAAHRSGSANLPTQHSVAHPIGTLRQLTLALTNVYVFLAPQGSHLAGDAISGRSTEMQVKAILVPQTSQGIAPLSVHLYMPPYMPPQSIPDRYKVTHVYFCRGTSIPWIELMLRHSTSWGGHFSIPVQVLHSASLDLARQYPTDRMKIHNSAAYDLLSETAMALFRSPSSEFCFRLVPNSERSAGSRGAPLVWCRGRVQQFTSSTFGGSRPSSSLRSS
ncbi:hypothetical protein N657DRAFT_261255 [Parathielavia appendiculata]|uniref:Uncharacterized protein n=1 Tax=Parathielavia appendiculata TaxID=2587402 RepID=A0AAN6TSH0_9PEZI|nr:hypothetical protein N657DRAFT_261255 [Parathielavia appendiculata]